MTGDFNTGREARGEKAKARLRFWPYAIVALVLAEIFIYRPVGLGVFKFWVFEAYKTGSGGMKDTLLVGDWVISDNLTYHIRDPRPGEIVSFTYPYRGATTVEKVIHLITTEYGGEGSAGLHVLVARVVGGPDDALELKNGVLLRNGAPVYEPYVFNDAGADWGPYVVPPDSYFVMGDNRNDTADSRFIGPVPRKYIRGRATAIYFSVAPTLCPKHGAPVVPYEGGWRCSAYGEDMRPGLDFTPAPRWRVDRRVRWKRIGRHLDALPRSGSLERTK
jgi:signal peptidase I